MTKTSNGNGEHTIQTFATLTHLVLALGTVVLACGIAYASLVQRVSAVESRIPAAERDHDLLVTISANIDSMKRDVNDLKNKIDEHTEKN